MNPVFRRYLVSLKSERLFLVGLNVAMFIGGYFGIGAALGPGRVYDLRTPIDDCIPFVTHSVWIYIWTFPAALAPAFFVRCPELFRRSSFAFTAVLLVSFICFALFPVSSEHLRADLSLLDLKKPSDSLVAFIYFKDPPFNLFPSLHVSINLLSAFVTWKASRKLGIYAFVSAALVMVSVCTLKQHYFLDAVGGAIIALIAAVIFLRKYADDANPSPACISYRFAAFVIFAALFYLGAYVAATRASDELAKLHSQKLAINQPCSVRHASGTCKS